MIFCRKASMWGLFFLLLVSGSVQGAAPNAAGIASAHPLATEAGREVIEAGGNAFDAAVAVSAALAVVEPYSSGLGGGGFWLLQRASDGRQVMLDGRERAPLAAHRDLFLDEAGEVAPGRSIDGALAAGIPGEPAALVHLAEHYGRLPLSRSLAPAIRLARNGFPVDRHYRRMAEWRLDALRSSPAAAGQFLHDWEIPAEGELIRQPDLASTLQLLADKGRDGFYAGELAQRLVKGVRDAGGIWSLQDLQQYQVVEREPIRGRYGELKIISAAPPSSGGVVLVTMLNILEGFQIDDLPRVQRVHLMIEAMRRAYRDRADYLGDPDFVDMPLQALTHPWYAAGLARDIQLERATPSTPQPVSKATEGADTTHFSIIDREGNRVAATLSINYPFGAAFVPAGTGVLLNDEMDDFSARPGVPNVYGLVGGEANAIAPGKRMLSSMSPTFVESDAGVAMLGTPGGSRIISMVLLAILELADGQPIAQWVRQPRFHHQYLPDRVEYEAGAFDDKTVTELQSMGHILHRLEREYGNMQALYWDRRSSQVTGASDPRGSGRTVIW
jgi:gamma-glutamyltranspeptidase/glutathione hydrolase